VKKEGKIGSVNYKKGGEQAEKARPITENEKGEAFQFVRV